MDLKEEFEMTCNDYENEFKAKLDDHLNIIKKSLRDDRKKYEQLVEGFTDSMTYIIEESISKMSNIVSQINNKED